MMTLHRTTALFVLIVGCLSQTGCQDLASQPRRESSQFVELFLDFKLADPSDVWTFRTPELWQVAAEDDNRFLQMKVPPARPMMPGVRRPQEYAVYNKYEFRTFSLSCWLRVDRDPSVLRRDACIIFGRQDDTHFYYAHLSGLSDDVHNTLIRVDGDRRQSLLPPDPRPKPAITDTQWHKVDVLRNADTGLIEIYVDERQPPLFRATDRTYEWGQIAIGSFDDHASFAGLRVKGAARLRTAAVKPAAPLPSPRGQP